MQRSAWIGIMAATLVLVGACAKNDAGVQATGPTSTTTAAAVTTTTRGAGGTTTTPGAGIGGGITPAATNAFLGSVASETTAVHTGVFDISLSIDGATGAPAHVSLLKLSGAYDKDANTSKFTLDVSELAKTNPGAFGEGTDASMLVDPIEVIDDGSVEYIKLPALAGAVGAADDTWFTAKADNSFKDLLDMFKVEDITSFLTTLQSSGSVKQVGNEDMGGAPTIHYRADINPSEIDTSKDASVGKLLQGFEKATQATVDVWVDDSALVHRLTITTDTSGVGPDLRGNYTDGTTTIDVSLSDLGQPVDIQAPPQDKVMDLNALGAGSGATATTDSTDPSAIDGNGSTGSTDVVDSVLDGGDSTDTTTTTKARGCLTSKDCTKTPTTTQP